MNIRSTFGGTSGNMPVFFIGDIWNESSVLWVKNLLPLCSLVNKLIGYVFFRSFFAPSGVLFAGKRGGNGINVRKNDAFERKRLV